MKTTRSANGWRDRTSTYQDLAGIGFTDDEIEAMLEFVEKHGHFTASRIRLESNFADGTFQITILS